MADSFSMTANPQHRNYSNIDGIGSFTCSRNIPGETRCRLQRARETYTEKSNLIIYKSRNTDEDDPRPLGLVL